MLDLYFEMPFIKRGREVKRGNCLKEGEASRNKVLRNKLQATARRRRITAITPTTMAEKRVAAATAIATTTRANNEKQRQTND